MNYPNGIKKEHKEKVKESIVYKNRGMTLEKMLNDTNNYYIEIKKAFIYKKPTPIKLVKVDYKKEKILEGYFEKPSTTDYIDFEAKETTNVKAFPISNIHKHQLEHLKNITKEKGIGFIIVRFSKLNKNYLLFAKDLFNYLDTVNKSSISIDYFNEKGYLIKDKFIPNIDYLEIVDKYGGIYEEEKN